MECEGVEWDIDSIAYLRDMAETMYGREKSADLTLWVVNYTLLYSDTDRQEMMDQIMNAHYEIYGAP